MTSKLSQRLQTLVSQQGDRTAPVTVRLRSDLSDKQVKTAVRKLESCLADAEYLAISGTVHGLLSLDAVARISALQAVEWIDVEKEAAIEELIDS